MLEEQFDDDKTLMKSLVNLRRHSIGKKRVQDQDDYDETDHSYASSDARHPRRV
jgi:hypothetical protein